MNCPLIGKWKVIKATYNSAELAEPRQETEIRADGTCILLFKSRSGDRIHRLTATYDFEPPDHISISLKPGEKGTPQVFVLGETTLELSANGITHILSRITDTEFTEPVFDASSGC
jgi:hypothetical protein